MITCRTNNRIGTNINSPEVRGTFTQDT